MSEEQEGYERIGDLVPGGIIKVTDKNQMWAGCLREQRREIEAHAY